MAKYGKISWQALWLLAALGITGQMLRGVFNMTRQGKETTARGCGERRQVTIFHGQMARCHPALRYLNTSICQSHVFLSISMSTLW
jgi:hypothetical protein